MVIVAVSVVSLLFLSQVVLPVTSKKIEIGLVGGIGRVADSSCTLQPGEPLDVNGCDWLSFLQALQDRLEESTTCQGRTLEEELEYLDAEFQESIGDTTKEVVDRYCAESWTNFDTSAFGQIDGEFTDDFMNKYSMGLTHLNSNTGNFQGDDVSERDGEIGENIAEFRDNEAEETLMQSFGAFDTTTCEGQAIMCCFGRDRQFGDDNGNCAEDDCEDADPADNSNLCFTETRSYPDDDPPENDIHCHGLAWGEDANDKTGKLAFNNFFFVSLYDHMYSRGYAERTIRREDDPAEFRMCDCVEKMPVVSRSDCTEVEINPFNFIRTDDGNLLITPPSSLDVQFNSCEGVGRNNDLSAYIRRLVNEGRFGDEQLEYNQKYVAKWPHCENVRCFQGTRTREFMQDKCDEYAECDGFSFSTNSDTGWGCLKECGFDDSSHGYGQGTHDYWEKQVPQAFETLVGYRNPDDNDNEEACQAVASPIAPTDAPVSPTDAPVSPTDAPIASPTTSPSVSPIEIVWEDVFVERFTGISQHFSLPEKRFSSDTSYEGEGDMSVFLTRVQKFSSTWTRGMRNYSKLELNFWYQGKNLNDENGFSLLTNFGSGYEVVGEWKMGEGDFNDNDQWLNAVVTVDNSDRSKKMRIQFQADINVGGRKIYFDQITVRGLLQPAEPSDEKKTVKSKQMLTADFFA